ncbi:MULTISPECIES: 3-hydroxyacyl-CoA dehydrogenase NAD-binding domain-containing protein [Burkholderia]|uniref:3-hydroxyacyl-CoA dehydrogenase NAD-binding domain-containing protein n=1 Tax=Burkholderia TaxID=32008 RepID=UPI00158BB389|nr:3-hydroxyacyl-CoA dehydrogenase NAD-binding domain-containing protein [Burkholderia seminalis]
MSSQFNELRFSVDVDGVAIALLDTPNRPVNALTEGLQRDLPLLAARLRDDASIKGLVLGSAKDSGFCAGADLGELGRTTLAIDERSDDATLRAAFDLLVSLHANLRQLETSGKPVVAALEGITIGGGLELALACHHRIAADGPKVRFSLPETGLGLIPGGGGTQRLPRLVGIAKALPVMLEGKPLDAKAALALGIVDALVPPGQTIAAAKAWILEGPGETKSVQPWDRPDYVIPGGGPYDPQVAQLFMVGNAMVRKGTYGNYPAQPALLSCVFEGLQVPIDNALRIETRHFLKTLASWQSKAMTRTLFESMQALSKGDARPAGVPASAVRKVAVLGAGMMGAGIAYVQAQAGIATVLIDRTQEAADKGKDYSRTLLEKAIARGKSTPEKAQALLSLIHPTTDFEAVRGSDLVIEAVFEDREVKADATRCAEVLLGDEAVFGSNTSTMPITSLAQASSRPANFIGVHFFSPVDRMGLVEVIMGEKTSDATLARTIDYIVKIRKTPIVVRDRRNFYTGQVFGTYIDEGVAMLLEGIAPAIIDNMGRAAGMPRGPLELYDDVSLDTPHHAAVQAKKDLGNAYQPRFSDAVLEAMVTTHGRLGRKNGQGFYDYPADGAPKRLWPGLIAFAEPTVVDASDFALQEELKQRFLFVQSLEVARCIEAGVIEDPRGCDVGAILGWGFPAWTGGPLGLIDGVGVARFVEICDALAAKCGARFEPPQLLRTMAREGRRFYPPAAKKSTASAVAH